MMRNIVNPYMADVAKGTLLFAGVGPPIGALPFSMVMLVAELPNLTPEDLMPAVVMTSIFSYFIGGIPAAATGMMAGVIRKYLVTFWRCLGVGALGFIMQLAYTRWTSSFWDVGLLFGCLGLLAGTACAMLFRPPAFRSHDLDNANG